MQCLYLGRNKGPMNTMPDIAKLVPHAKPMLLVDRVLEASNESLSAKVTIRGDDLFFQDNADAKGVGAWVGIEYMAQAVAAHAGYLAYLKNEPVKIGFLLGTREYICHRAYFDVGSVLSIHVKKLFRGDNGTGLYECFIADEAGDEVAYATLTVFQPDSPNSFSRRNDT